MNLVDNGGVPALGGLKFSMAQQKVQKSATWGKCHLGEVPLGRSATWGKCHLGEVPLGGSATWGTGATWGTKI